MRREIERRSGVIAIDIYGLSEIIGPGVASECMAQNGLHINEDHFIAEVIESNKPDMAVALCSCHFLIFCSAILLLNEFPGFPV